MCILSFFLFKAVHCKFLAVQDSMPNSSILIIGAGLAGLSTGCYAQMNGYKTQIFEMSNKPGGVCVSWKRKDYNFDYAVHNVFGISKKPTGTIYNRLWDELGATKADRHI